MTLMMNKNNDDNNHKKQKSDDRNNNEKNKNISTSDMTRRMVCGGLAGMVAKTATNPLERIKMLSQTGEHGISSSSSSSSGSGSGSGSSSNSTKPKPPSIIAMYRQIIKNEGVIGLWAGNGTNLLRVFPAKAIVFSTNDMYKGILYRLTGTSSNDAAGGSLSFIAGGFAGMTATAATYPMDFARGRISGKLAGANLPSTATITNGSSDSKSFNKQVRPTKDYSGITKTIILTVKDEGLLALYKGMTPTILGAMPYEGIKFGTVGLLETLFPTKQDQPASYYVTRKMFMGGMGGVMAGLITYPNDTIRRLLQLQGSRGTTSQFTGYFDCARKTYQEHGIKRFYLGVTINTLRMLPNVAIQFGSYELLKRWSANFF